jgi:hypothetical protein
MVDYSPLSLFKSEFSECTICLFHTGIDGIKISADGICNICLTIETLKEEFGTGTKKGQDYLLSIVTQIKRDGVKNRYDCIVGVSGGTDSSYLLLLAKEWGLRPLAVHYDNTWNSAIATTNISKVLNSLNVDLYTYVVKNKEADDIFQSAFTAGVAELDASTDLAFAYLLRKIARKKKIKYILEGHSFIEEGITPLGRNYFDGAYVRGIHRKFGKYPMKTYPLMTLSKFLYESIIGRVQFIRPLWYIDYEKSAAREVLKNHGWRDYGGHHLENALTAFLHSAYLPKKFNTDMRNNVLSAQIRRGAITKQNAQIAYSQEPFGADSAAEYFMRRLGISQHEFDRVMNQTPRAWTEFKTYKRNFEILRPLFRILVKKRFVTQSFYLKYCIKGKHL